MRLFPISLSGRPTGDTTKRGGRRAVEGNPYAMVRRILVAVVTGALPDEQRSDAVSLLTQALLGAEEDVRALAVIGLSELGAVPDIAVPALARALLDPNDTVRRRAARALGDFGSAAVAAVPQLALALRDREVSVRVEAIGTLGRIGPGARAALPTLIPMIGDEDTRIRIIVGVTLRRMGPYAVPYLMRALTEPEGIIRERAAVLLGQIGLHHDAVVQALLEACSDPEPEIRQAAREAISKLE